MTKYDLFFKSFKERAVDLEFVADKKSYKYNYKEHNFCSSINSFLSKFDEQVKFKNNGFGSGLFNISSILKAQKRASEKNIELEIRKVKLVEGAWEDRAADFEEFDLLFLSYDEIGSSYEFVDRNVENPLLYLYWGGGCITCEDIVFTTFVRGALFWQMLRSLDQLSSNHKLDRINWIKFYSRLNPNHKNIRQSLMNWRYKFYSLVEKNQLEHKNLIGIDEFEVVFIKYLIEDKGLDTSQNIFNP